MKRYKITQYLEHLSQSHCTIIIIFCGGGLYNLEVYMQANY